MGKIQRGPQKTRRGGGNRRKGGFAGVREQTQCRFCRRGVKYVDYKDIETLSKLLYTLASAAGTVPVVNVRLRELLNVLVIWLCCLSRINERIAWIR